MVTVKINDQSSLDWLYDAYDSWKDYVCEDFDETFVLIGNHNMYTQASADWYKRAKSLLDDMDCTDELETLSASDYKISDDILKLAIKYYQTHECIHNELIKIKDLIEIMNPDDTFNIDSIHGYSQGDWQTVLYKSTNMPENIIDTLSTYYFGKLVEIIIEHDEADDEPVVVGCMSHDDLWEHNTNDTLKTALCEEYDLDINRTKFLKSDGVITTIKYKEI